METIFSECTSEYLLLHLSLYDEIKIDWLSMEHAEHDVCEYDGMYELRRTIYTTKISKDFKHLINFISKPTNVYGKCPRCDLYMSLKVNTVEIDTELSNEVVDEYPEDYLSDDDFCNDTDREERLMLSKLQKLLANHLFITKNFRCTYTSSYEHSYRAEFKLNFYPKDKVLTLQKIGQFPSIADFMDCDIKPYEKLLKKFNSLEDFRKGYYMNAHGLGIGSYAYLRRVLEKLIYYKYNESKANLSITQDEFLRLRMDEKLRLLKDILPEFLVENTSLYHVVSAGIHTLDEDMCKKYFPIIKNAIELILEQEVSNQKQDKLKKETSKALSTASVEIEQHIKN